MLATRAPGLTTRSKDATGWGQPSLVMFFGDCLLTVFLYRKAGLLPAPKLLIILAYHIYQYAWLFRAVNNSFLPTTMVLGSSVIILSL